MNPYYIPPKKERDRELLKSEGLNPKEWTYVSQDAESVTFRHRDGTPKYIRR